jgi:DNA-binding SARP family transcriptional activator
MKSPILHAQLFGGFSLVYDNTAIAGINSARLQSLLAFLILHAASPQSRQQIAFLFWPDTSEAQARNNLRQFLFQLRQILPDSDRFLQVDSNTIFWKTDENQIIDVWLFNRALKDADLYNQRGDKSLQRIMLEQAISAYQGDLLPGSYDEWIQPEREGLRLQSQNAHRKLIQILETQREYALALTIGQRLLNLDPLDEGTYVTLLRLHALNDDLNGARRVYQNAVETLQRELDVEPNEMLRSTYQRLQDASRAIAAQGGDKSSIVTSFKLVGRQLEWQQLQAAWKRSVGGNAHLILITGEAGIGKSRLAEELFSWVMRQGFATAYSRSYGVEGRLSLGPVTDLLRSGNIHSHIAALDKVWIKEIARLLPELLVEHPDLGHPAPISEYGQRQLFFEALARAIHAGQHPLLLWIDDLHWSDQETLEWLHFLLRFEPHTDLLILGTARSEESPPEHPLSLMARQLRVEDKISTVELSPLDAAETAKLASEVQGYTLEDRDTIRLFRETEGNPLFVVETIRANAAGAVAIETNRTKITASSEAHLPPPRVHAVILGRLVQLSPQARNVAEIGAVIGRAFPLDLLLQAVHDNEETIIHALNELWQKRILWEQSVNTFDFTHDKLREVTYLEISAPQRRLLHRNVAQALAVIKADDLDVVSAQLATHYEQAGMLEKAIPYYQRAGAVAANVYANEDAVHLLTHGLELLAQLPPGQKRDAQELALQLALAPIIIITNGHASMEVERVWNRALVLSDKVGDIEQRIHTWHGIELVYLVRAQYEKVEQAYAQMEKLFMRTQSDIPLPYVMFYAGAKQQMGEFVKARELFDRMVAVRDDKHIQDLQASQGWNYLVLGHAWNSHALWCLGYPQAAFNSAITAMQFAREFAQPFNRAVAIAYLALLQELRADAETFRTQAEAAFVLTREHKVIYYFAWSSILLNFAQAWQRPSLDNLLHLREAIRALTDTGARIRLPYYFSLLARGCQRAGQFDEGLAAIDQGLTESLQNNEHWWDAELHRLHGELMSSQGKSVDEVEQDFHRSIEIARSQSAKSLELRAATSLARLWQANSRSAEAKQLLVPLYEWFTEGFDTPDLQTARALLAQL